MVSTPGSARLTDYFPRPAGRVAVGVLAVFIGLGLANNASTVTPLDIAAALLAVGAGALLLSARQGLVLAYAALATAGVAVLGHGTASNVGWFAVCLLSAWCLLAGSRRHGLVYWLGALAMFGVEWVWVEPEPGWGTWMAGVTFTVLASLLVRHELDLVAQLRAAQAGLVERATLEERNRISRELHDVIAHTLTVSLLHVTSARLAVEYDDPAEAARVLAEAERLCRDSLTEVRSAVGLLRPDGGDVDGDGTFPPVPGMGGLPVLVERFRAAGAEVALTIEGDTEGLSATTGLAVYRILQEALTNAIKHAPGAAIAVEVAVEEATVDVVVDSSGTPGRGTGLGIISMRERAELLGGTCGAGPGGRGWLVRATLPLHTGEQREAAP